uniref:Uncharacterized protein n=1 Tax=Anguilla anguilla TaxID=7936 RepID=A0A0E9X4T6_ANGAN
MTLHDCSELKLSSLVYYHICMVFNIWMNPKPWCLVNAPSSAVVTLPVFSITGTSHWNILGLHAFRKYLCRQGDEVFGFS